jgi:hypothetical protein
MQGVVFTLSNAAGDNRRHESLTRAEIARRLAALKGYAFGGEYAPSRRMSAHVYFVPADTLVGIDDAAKLGIETVDDVFGAVVPHAFVATKSITHPPLDGHSRVPAGWSTDFATRVASSVLAGYSAFSRDDARRAAERMLGTGTVRIKRAIGIGGTGQWVANGRDGVARILGSIDDDELERVGIVVEQHLSNVVTRSVGQVHVAGLLASYWGTQRLTPNNAGTDVYGGSELHVVRGGFDALLEQPLADDIRLAVMQARDYDAAAFDCYAGMFASRRNYDVAQGVDASGEPCSGVLEQSWRIGGASGAEVAALEAFAADRRVTGVRASTVEIYGASDAPPAGAVVYFRDTDEHVGPLTKYARVEPHGHTR